MKHRSIYIALTSIILLLCTPCTASAQKYLTKPQNQPFSDQKLYRFGFYLGIHTQDMIISHTGHMNAAGESWYTEIPSYSPGFSVGLIADRYLTGNLNLRVSPALHFGEKKFVFKEQRTGTEETHNFRSSYISLPLHLKFSANRTGNYRPYLIGGIYSNFDIGAKKNAALRFNTMDYGLEVGLGCSVYLPLFKLSPELKFSYGLSNVINTNTDDVSDADMMQFRQSVRAGRTRMMSLVFNFE